MNKLLLNLLAGILLISISANAQPTLTASGVNPSIGESTNFYSDTSITWGPGNSGAGQTWDLSSYTPDVAGPSTYIAVSSTPDGASFPLANMAAASGAGYAYSNVSSSAYQYVGVSANGVIMSYSDPEDLLRFPFTYNDTYQDPWLTQFTSTGYVFERRGYTTVTADSWGTLITPAGTYNNALRVRVQQAYQDSTNIGIPYIINYINEEYIWYAEGIHSALATMYHLSTSMGQDFYGGSYLASGSGINTPSSLSTFDISPNPASEEISVRFDLSNNNDVAISVINSQGQIVKTLSNLKAIYGMNSLVVDIADLSAGIYFAKIYSDGFVSESRKFIVIK